MQSTLVLFFLPAVALSVVHHEAFLAPDRIVPSKVQFNAHQHASFGCLAACHPSPVESKCVTACEVDAYQCIDETGPNETPEDTKKCMDKILKHYQETKG